MDISVWSPLKVHCSANWPTHNLTGWTASTSHNESIHICDLVITLLSICQAPSVLAAERPTYADLAGIRESETYLG